MAEAKWIWTPCHLPKTSFIHWFATQDRLLTEQRMIQMNLNISYSECLLCDESSMDSKDHLFFSCTWSKSLIDLLANWLGSNQSPSSMKALYRWLKRLKVQKVKEFYTTTYSAAIYYIWIARYQKYNKRPCSADQIFKIIKGELSVLLRKTAARRRAHLETVLQCTQNKVIPGVLLVKL